MAAGKEGQSDCYLNRFLSVSLLLVLLLISSIKMAKNLATGGPGQYLLALNLQMTTLELQ